MDSRLIKERKAISLKYCVRHRDTAWCRTGRSKKNQRRLFPRYADTTPVSTPPQDDFRVRGKAQKTKSLLYLGACHEGGASDHLRIWLARRDRSCYKIVSIATTSHT